MKPLISPLPAALLAAVLLVLLVGCDEKDVPKNDYFPLRDGNRWEYRLLDRPLLKRLADGQEVTTADLNADLRGEFDEPPEEIAREKAGEVEETDEDGAPIPKDLRPLQKEKGKALARRVVLELRQAVDDITFRAVYDASEQVWSKRNGYVGFQGAKGRNYLLILPPHTNYKWVVTDPAGQDLYFVIEAAIYSVETPAGTFPNCAVVRQESRDRKEIFRYCFAPNVGLVRRSKYVADEEVFRQELVEYKVKPPTDATKRAEEKEIRKALEGKNRGSEFRERGGESAETKRDKRDKRASRNEQAEEPNEKIKTFEQPK